MLFILTWKVILLFKNICHLIINLEMIKYTPSNKEISSSLTRQEKQENDIEDRTIKHNKIIDKGK